MLTSLQLSDAVASSMGISSEHPPLVGRNAELRCRCVLNSDGLVADELLPASSVAVNVRVTVAAVAVSPVVSLLTSIVTSPQLSDAVASSRINSSEHSAV